MQVFTISVTVSSERAALAVVEIARACYGSARLVYLSILGGMFQTGRALIECTANDERTRRAGWAAFVDKMNANGYSRAIY